MKTLKSTAIAFSNIAFIKYWGNRDHALRIPVNNSFSMNLKELYTRTTVTLDAFSSSDELFINGKQAGGAALARVSQVLDLVRVVSGKNHFIRVESESNFPTGAGIASSAAAFAALALAASKAAGLDLDEPALSRLARRGSGSASRSVPGGFVEWQAGGDDESSYAFSIAPADHWELADCVAIVSSGHKATGSTQGHALAHTSPLQAARVADAPRRIEICRNAILRRDFEQFASIAEADSDLMHAVMMTSNPALFYWKPATLRVMQAVRDWRAAGIPVFYTIDAGPNVHVITLKEEMLKISKKLKALAGVSDVLTVTVGGAAHWVEA